MRIPITKTFLWNQHSKEKNNTLNAFSWLGKSSTEFQQNADHIFDHRQNWVHSKAIKPPLYAYTMNAVSKYCKSLTKKREQEEDGSTVRTPG